MIRTTSRSAENVKLYALYRHDDSVRSIPRSMAKAGTPENRAELLNTSINWAMQKMVKRRIFLARD